MILWSFADMITVEFILSTVHRMWSHVLSGMQVLRASRRGVQDAIGGPRCVSGGARCLNGCIRGTTEYASLHWDTRYATELCVAQQGARRRQRNG